MDGLWAGLGVMIGVALREMSLRRRNGHANGVDALPSSTPATGSGPTVIQVDDTQGQIAKLNRDLGRVEQKVDTLAADCAEDRKKLMHCVAIAERTEGGLGRQGDILDRLVVDVRDAPKRAAAELVKKLQDEGLVTVKRREVSPE